MDNMMIAGVGLMGFVLCCCIMMTILISGVYFMYSSGDKGKVESKDKDKDKNKEGTNSNNQTGNGPCDSASFKSFQDSMVIEPATGKTAPSTCDAYKALIDVFGSTEKLLTEPPRFRFVSGTVFFGYGDITKTDQPYLRNGGTKDKSTSSDIVVFKKEKYTFAIFENAVLSKIDPNNEKKENATTELSFTLKLKN